MSRAAIEGFSIAAASLGEVARKPWRFWSLTPIALTLLAFALVWWSLRQLIETTFANWWGGVETGIAILALAVTLVISSLLTIYLFVAIAAVVAAPFNSRLACLAERHFASVENTGYANATGNGPLQPLRLIRNEAAKALHLVLLALPIVVISLIPLLNFSAPFLWLAYGAWALSVNFFDYPLGNHDIFFREQRTILLAHLPLVMGFGIAMLLFASVPLLNLVAVPAGVIGATRLMLRRFPECRR